MADNKFYNNQKIYVETDYENIIIVDPNKVIDSDNKVQERLVNHEELVKYVNLEAKVLPRTKLVVGDNFDDTVQNLRVGTMSNDDKRKINFLFPEGKDGYDTSWTEEITGNDSLIGKGLNQTKLTEVGQGENKSVVRTITNPEDTQLLGITNVQIKINTAFAPQVTIEMVDVQGRTLFEQGENSPYSAFMQLPYPLFILTIKGYFGKAVKYELMLKDFNARFDSSDGNYKITTNYIARTYAILSDISLNNLYTLPHMYQKSFEVNGTTTTNSGGQGQQTSEINTLQSTKGTEILKQVYSDYRSKGLIGDDFPNQQTNPLTLPVLEKKLENFDRYVMESYSQEDMSVLIDISEFTNTINKYRRDVFGGNSEWFSKYIDKDNTLIPIDKNKSILYGFKKNLSLEQIKNSITELEAIITKNNDIIKTDATFGENGSCVINGEKVDSSLSFDCGIDNFITTINSLDEIDLNTTYTKINRRPPQDEIVLDNFRQNLTTQIITEGIVIDFNTKNVEETSGSNTFFKFGNLNGSASLENGSFLKKIQILEDKFQKQKKIIEDKLSVALAEKIKSPTGLGFNPTIKNVMAVICANTDAFFRLMDNVHEDAWNKREDPIRLDVILGNNVDSVETKDNVQGVSDDGLQTNLNPVYPWPQYVEETIDEKGNTQYEDKYPGDVNCINRTQAYRYDVWPEVEFVEEYIRAAIEVEEQNIDTNNPNEGTETQFISANSILFPFSNNVYTNKTIVPFFYEILERTLLSSNYTNLYKNSGYAESIYSVLADFEKLNIQNASSDSIELLQTLKNFSFTYENFIRYIQSISNNGSFNLLIRNEYVTPYIKNSVKNSYGIYNTSYITENPTTVEGSTDSSDKLKKYLKSNISNENGFLDKYPFTNLNWVKNNLSEGNKINEVSKSNSTTQIYDFIEGQKTIASFNITDKELDKKLYTYFEWITNVSSNPEQKITNITDSINGGIDDTIISNQEVINYYTERTNKKLYITESKLNYGVNYDKTVNNLVSEQTTSLLNTPYFINALLKGVNKHKQGELDPYTTLGYLYLNSLPLPTLREKFKSFENGTTTNLDYIFAGLNKFSALHKVPYFWILKYGSIWYRYKKYHENNIDIISDVWDNFDYVNAYDPITNNRNKLYNIKNFKGEEYQYRQKTTTNSVLNDPTPISIETIELNNGLYPKVINDIYWYFTNKDIFSNYTTEEFEEAYTNRNLKILSDSKNRISEEYGYDPLNPNRELDIRNWSQYFDIKGNTEFDDYDKDKILIIPSVGDLKFNQSKFECFNSGGVLTLDIIDNDSVYNGTVRSLWGAPNFGYFNNNLVKMPNYNEYLKTIDPNTDNQQAFNLKDNTDQTFYDSIEEMFNVFTKDMLDDFETHFLNFCKPKNEFESDIVGRGGQTFEEFIQEPQFQDLYTFNEETNQKELPITELYKLKALYSNQTPSLGNVPTINPYETSLYSVIKSLFIIDKPTIGDDSSQNIKNISDKQIDSFVRSHKVNFLTKEIILKIGNPGKYDRKVYNSFSTSESFYKVDKYEFGSYVSNTLPTSGNSVTLLDSIIQNPTAWRAMYLYVGEYNDEDKLTYKNDGSYITDFFVDMDIEFSEENVVLLNNIIKLYASKKLENNSLSKEEFNTLFNDFLIEQRDFQENILNEIFIKLNKDLPSVTTTQKDNDSLSATDGELEKISLWKTFQTMNDKWISGQDFKTRTIFEDFLFLDRANRPIGDLVVINIYELLSFLKTRNSDATVYSLMGSIYEKNNFVFMPTPVYTNFYGLNDRTKEGEVIDQDIPNDTFGTFMEVDTRDTRPRMLGIYVGEPSTNLDMKENKNVKKNDDSFDITRPSGNPLVESTNNKSDYADGNRCVGFNVDFGTRNQGIFKSISLDMQQHKNIAPTFQVLADLGSQASGQKVAQQSQSLYNFYRSKSYTCQITSMGNAMIQPTMYFNLQRVPLFYGPYLIMSVNHTINSNDFITQFEGIRVSKYSLQQPNQLVISANKKILEAYKNKLRKQSGETITGNTNGGVSTSTDQIGLDESRCEGLSKYPLKEFLPLNSTEINTLKTITALNNTTLNNDMKVFIYGLTMKGKNSVKVLNNNLVGININDLNSNLANNYTDGQLCIKTQSGNVGCLASFNSVSDCINMLADRYKNQETLLNDLKPLSNPNTIDGRAIAMSRLLYKNIYKNKITGNNGSTIKTQINELLSKDSNLETNFNNWTDIFKNSINKLSN